MSRPRLPGQRKSSFKSWTVSIRRLFALTPVITPFDVKTFGREVMQRLFIESLLHGNTSPEVSHLASALTSGRRGRSKTC